MGSTISALFNRLFSKKPVQILMVGLNGAGKTTILYRLKIGEVTTTIPSIGIYMETVEYKNLSFNVWDIPGGRDKMKPIWRHYYPNTDGIIFVVDSNDRRRVAEAHDDLHDILREEDLRDSLLLVFANKQDLPNSMTAEEVANKLRLAELKDRNWHITATCRTEGTSLYEGFDWLCNELSNKT